MRIYISGPISEMPNDNREAFEQAAKILMRLEVFFVNPHTLAEMYGYYQPWNDLMRVGLQAMLMWCDSILMLDGWKDSKGATLEHTIATTLGYDIYVLKNGFLAKEHE